MNEISGAYVKILSVGMIGLKKEINILLGSSCLWEIQIDVEEENK